MTVPTAIWNTIQALKDDRNEREAELNFLFETGLMSQTFVRPGMADQVRSDNEQRAAAVHAFMRLPGKTCFHTSTATLTSCVITGITTADFQAFNILCSHDSRSRCTCV